MRELICGKNSVKAAITNKLAIKVIYTTKPHELIVEKTIDIKHVDKNFLDNLTRENHQGFIAELKQFNYYDFEVIKRDKPQKILILDHIQDPRNLGAIIRSANAFGFKHIILPRARAAKLTLSALKVASGGFVDLKIIRVNSLSDIITKLKKQDFWIYASALVDAINLKTIQINYPVAMIVGNEAKGISRTLLKQADQKIYIPMQGNVESLNVAVAASILMFYF